MPLSAEDLIFSIDVGAGFPQPVGEPPVGRADESMEPPVPSPRPLGIPSLHEPITTETPRWPEANEGGEQAARPEGVSDSPPVPLDTPTLETHNQQVSQPFDPPNEEVVLPPGLVPLPDTAVEPPSEPPSEPEAAATPAKPPPLPAEQPAPSPPPDQGDPEDVYHAMGHVLGEPSDSPPTASAPGETLDETPQLPPLPESDVHAMAHRRRRERLAEGRDRLRAHRGLPPEESDDKPLGALQTPDTPEGEETPTARQTPRERWEEQRERYQKAKGIPNVDEARRAVAAVEGMGYPGAAQEGGRTPSATGQQSGGMGSGQVLEVLRSLEQLAQQQLETLNQIASELPGLGTVGP